MSKEEFTDYYKLLGVNREASPEEIQKAFRRKAKELHPDTKVLRSQSEKLAKEQELKEITEAYAILKNSTKKAKYDRKYDSYQRKQKERTKTTHTSNSKRSNPQQNSQYQQYQRDNAGYQQRRYQRDNTRHQQSQYQQYQRDNARYHQESQYQQYQRNNARYQSSVEDEEDFDYDFRHTINWFQRMHKYYQEIRQEEKKQNFFERHKEINNILKEEAWDAERKTLEFKIFSGRIHISEEFAYQLEKLTYYDKEPIPKFILRNRMLVVPTIILGITLCGTIINSNLPDPTEISVSSENPIEQEYNQRQNSYILNNYHQVKTGDTLSQLAYDSGTSQSIIAELNNLPSNNVIQIGTTLKVPYRIAEDDLEYYLQPQVYDPNISLEEYANMYHTDIETLVKINEETITPVESGYAVSSDTLSVPSFIGKDELQAKKEGKLYSKKSL